MIGQRLARLSEPCNDTLVIAAVIGREFGFEHLRALFPLAAEEELLRALEEALAARLIEELPSTAGRYQFAHALIRGCLVDELSAARRVRLHARIAEALEQLYGSDAQVRAAELAYHYAEARSVLGTERLVAFQDCR